MRTRVKICGLTRLQDAELAAEAGADILGFVLEPTSRRSIHENPEALQIPERLGPYVMCAAVLGPYRPVPPQFHMIQCLDEVPRSAHRPALKALRVAADDTVDTVLERIGRHSAVHLDAFDTQLYGGTGRRVDWAVAAEVVVRSRAKVILAGGLTPDNVAAAIQWVKPYGVDVSGGVEAEIGVKDAGKLRAFVQAARG
ncbi:MAG TPA: phosphoribosylanthranilate isomerase [Fimbriimonadaceae bacterium]|nr:phosphoribosylanthranilate isomerase [Fimbriimonadaceae bacterium]